MNWMLENLNGIALALLPIQAMLVIFYFRRKYPPLRRRDTFGMVIGSGIILTGLGFASGLTALYAGSYLSLLFGIRSFFGAQNPERFLEHRTGLFNRRSFEGVMQENFGRRYWLVSFGIYNYADVRELYGAQQMDRCLAQIGSWIRKTFPGVNSYYLRNGIFILQSFQPLDQETVSHRIQQRFGESWQVGESERFLDVGCAFLDSSICVSSVHVLMNCISMAHRHLDEKVQKPTEAIQVDGKYVRGLHEERAVKRALERAVENDSVCVFLQPIVDASSQRVVGAEALARLFDDELGYISPGNFIPIAEKDGSISALGRQVFRKTCDFMSRPEIQQLGLDWVNVNLSPVQCMNPHLAEEFIGIQQAYGVPAEKIHLEITEESIINLATLQDQIARMRAKGFRFVLDDYGSGYSNLMMVRKIPFINIKLDMSFVRAHFQEPNTLLPDTIRAFRELGFSITAEGVETSAMALALDQMDTTYLQGFHYAKPMPMEDFYAFMKSHEEAGEAAEEGADESRETAGKAAAAAEDEAEKADEASAEDLPLAASSVC